MITVCLVGAWLVRGSSGVGAGVLLVAGLAPLGFLVRSVLLLPPDGGLWLSPSGLTHRWRRQEWQAPWSEVQGAELESAGPGAQELDIRVLLRSGDTRTISTHLLVMDPVAVSHVVQGLAGPQSQGSSFVGSEAMLRDTETVRSGYVPSWFVVRGAGRLTRQGMGAAIAVLVVVIFALAALGRHTQVSRTDLEDVVRGQLEASGAGVSAVDCDGAVHKEAGETQTCTATVDGAARRLRVSITQVDGDRVSYRVTPR